MNKSKFVSELGKLRSAATFLTLSGYKSESGEVANYSIVFNMSYENALNRSIQTLKDYVPENELEITAKKELLDSFNKSLEKIKITPVEEIDDNYTHFQDEDGKFIKGVKLHEKTDTLHLYGLIVHKKVLTPGTYKEVKSKPLTLAKDKLRKMCSVSKFRQFKIVPEQLEFIAVNNISLLPPL